MVYVSFSDIVLECLEDGSSCNTNKWECVVIILWLVSIVALVKVFISASGEQTFLVLIIFIYYYVEVVDKIIFPLL